IHRLHGHVAIISHSKRGPVPCPRACPGQTTALNFERVNGPPNVSEGIWPPLPLDGWEDTYATLHMWTQIVGKLALKLSPLPNHFWNTALQVPSRGLATLPLTAGHRTITVTFDFVADQLLFECSDGRGASIPLEPRPVAEFYRLAMEALARLNVRARIWTMPVEVPNPIRFDAD